MGVVPMSRICDTARGSGTQVHAEPKNVLLAVGDVARHGIATVTGMVALRNCLRGLAVAGAGPGQVLTWLNTAAFHLSSSDTGDDTCLVAVSIR